MTVIAAILMNPFIAQIKWLLPVAKAVLLAAACIPAILKDDGGATWFVFNPENWWMGVCHLPLLIISFYGLRMSSYRCCSQGAVHSEG